jgi:hypothetical protein
VSSPNWFEEAIAKYSESFTQKLYDLLRSINDLGANSTDLLKNVLTNPELTAEHIDEMISKLDFIQQSADSSSSNVVVNIKETIDEFSKATSQLEILNILIQRGSLYAGRVALFILSGERTIGWLAWGFIEDAPKEISRKKLEIMYASSTIIYQIKESGLNFVGQPPSSMENSRLFQDLGGIFPGEIACLPLFTKNRVSGVLYLDQGGAQAPIKDLTVLEVEVQIAGMMIDLIPLRKSLAKKEEAAQAPPAAAGLPFQASAASAPASQTRTPPPFMQPGKPVSAPPIMKPQEPQSAQPDLPPFQSQPSQPQQTPFADTAKDAHPSFVSTQKIPQQPAAPEPKTGTFGMQGQQAPEQGDTPMGFQISAQPINPPAAASNITQFPPQYGTPGEEISKSEKQAQDEAKRFARLLILEIKLYNEDKVMEGRKNKNLYSLLKEEIDRSREVFNERMSPDINTSTDFFSDELLNILAGGDPNALGM